MGVSSARLGTKHDATFMGVNCCRFNFFNDSFLVKTPKHIQMTIRYNIYNHPGLILEFLPRVFRGSLGCCHGYRKVIGAGALGALFFSRLGGGFCRESMGKSSGKPLGDFPSFRGRPH